VLLVDDVLLSGATLGVLAELLSEAGAARVCGYTATLAETGMQI
jgi:predicted amidophosphoribosyltransferase